MKYLLLTVAVFFAICSPTLAQSPSYAEPEDFRYFLYRFFTDSTLQAERTRFPLEAIVYDLDLDAYDTTYVARADWNFAQYDYFEASYHIQIYDNHTRKLADTDERVLSYEGVENGINFSLYFERKNGRWYLVRSVDEST